MARQFERIFFMPEENIIPPAVIPVKTDLKIENERPPVPSEEVIEIFKQNGIAVITNCDRQPIIDLAKIGYFSEGVGMMRIQSGSIIVSQAQLRQTLTVLTEKINTEHLEPEELAMLTRSAAYVAKILNDTTATAMKHFSGKHAAGEKPAGKTPSLPPGAVLQVNVAPGSNVQIVDKTVDAPKTP
jgi:hypothetical protein